MKTCPRCNGSLVHDQIWHPSETVRMLPVWRCLNCGETLDHGILRNRFHQTHQMKLMHQKAA